MNTKNNKRRRESTERIKNAFLESLRSKEISKIKVSDICKAANINRSTFYANYLDIYDLADKIFADLQKEVSNVFDLKNFPAQSQNEFLELLRHIKKHQELYGFYFALGYESRDLQLIEFSDLNVSIREDTFDYHIEFFKNGFNAIVKMWLKKGCKESPEQIFDILLYEYRGR